LQTKVQNTKLANPFKGQRRSETRFYDSGSGWPDSANFRLLGDCLLLKITISSKDLGYFFQGKSYICIKFDKKWLGPHSGRCFFTNSAGHPDSGASPLDAMMTTLLLSNWKAQIGKTRLDWNLSQYQFILQH
jgi:hypothetical protein